MNNDTSRQYRTGICYRAALMVTGAMCAGLGLAVLIAMGTHHMTWARLLSRSAPMPPAVAAGFLACGAGLVGIALWFPVAACILGMATFGIAAVTAFRTLAGVDIGVDVLLFRNMARVPESAPVSPNTIVCLLLAGIAIVLRGLIHRIHAASGFIAALGSAILAVGLTASYGYMVGLPLHTWHPAPPMAFLSAIGCVLAGLGVVMMAWRYSELDDSGAPRWFPSALAAGAVSVNVCLALPILFARHAQDPHGWTVTAAVLVPSFAVSMLTVRVALAGYREPVPVPDGATNTDLLREFFQKCPEPVCLITQAGRIQDANAAWNALFGTHENGARSVLELLHPDDRAGAASSLRGLGPGRETDLLCPHTVMPGGERPHLVFRRMHSGIVVTLYDTPVRYPDALSA